MIYKICAWLSGTSLMLLMALMVANAFSRRVLNAPIENSTEIVQYILMPCLAFFAMPLAFRRKEQVEAPIVYDRLPARMRRELDVVGAVLIAVLLMGFAWFGWESALESKQISETAGFSDLPVWWVRLVIPVVALISIAAMVRALRPSPADGPSGQSGSADYLGTPDGSESTRDK